MDGLKSLGIARAPIALSASIIGLKVRPADASGAILRGHKMTGDDFAEKIGRQLCAPSLAPLFLGGFEGGQLLVGERDFKGNGATPAEWRNLLDRRIDAESRSEEHTSELQSRPH